MKILQGEGTPRRIAEVTRIQQFCSAHRLHSPHLTDKQNEILFGKCNHRHGHGHNYKVEVTLRGPIDHKTGLLVNDSDLHGWIQGAVMDPLDRKNIDTDVDWFKSNCSTVENIAIYIWGQLKAVMRDDSGLLSAVKLWETDDHFTVYRGEEPQ